MHWTAALAAATISACLLPACGKTKCQMDTECPLPQLCVAGECVFRSSDAVIDDALWDLDVDTFDMDTIGDPPDGTDLPDSVDVEADDVPPTCTPNPPSLARVALGAGISSGPNGDPDWPQIITTNVHLSAGTQPQVWAMGRIVNGTSPDQLTYVKLTPTTGRPATVQYSPVGNQDLDRFHPVARIENGMVTVFKDLSGVAANKIMFIIMQFQPTGSPESLPLASLVSSDEYSSHPNVAGSDTEIMVVWRQSCDACTTSRINFERMDLAGTSLGSGTIVGDGSENLDMPAIASSGTSYGIAYFVNTGTGADRMEFLEVDSAGAAVAGSSVSTAVSAGMHLIDGGRPAITWSGSSYAILWEEVSGSAGNLRFTTVTPATSYSYTDVVLNGSLSTTTGEITNVQDGMRDIECDGSVYGIASVPKNPDTGGHD